MIAKMENIEVVCLREDLGDLLGVLQEQGVVHLEEVSAAASQAQGFLHKVHLTEAQRSALGALEQFEKSLAEVEPLLSVRPDEGEVRRLAKSFQAKETSEWNKLSRKWIKDLRTAARRRHNVQDNLDVLASYERTLRHAGQLISNNSVVLGKNARAFVLKGDVAHAIDDLERHLAERLPAGYALSHAQVGKNTAVGALTYPEEHNEAVSQLLEDHRISTVESPDKQFDGVSLPELVARLGTKKEEQEELLHELEAEQKRASEEIGPSLVALRRVARDAAERIRALHLCAQSKLVGVLHGWCPTESMGALRQALDAQCGGRYVLSTLPVHPSSYERVPVELENHPIFKPFEVLLSLFRPPTYGRFDPSAMVGVAFVLFYGFILGDVAYGIGVVICAALLRKYLGKKFPAADAAGIVATYAGISAIIFGAIYGELFGDFGIRVWRDGLGLPDVFFHRAYYPLIMLKISLAMGAVHVVTSLLLGIREAWKSGDHHHLNERVALLFGLLASGLGIFIFFDVLFFGHWFFIGLAIVLFAACVIIMVRTFGFMAAVQIIEVVSVTTNVLSYSRLMALGVASIALADVANMVGRSMHPLAGVPVALAIHLLNLGIGIFSPALHSLRLNYVESMTKFYDPQGRRYQPFKKEALS